MVINKVIDKLINIVAFLYVISVFVLSSQPNYSLSSSIFAILLLIIILFKYIVLKRIYLPKLIFFFPLLVLYASITVIWVKDYDVALISLLGLLSTVTGAIVLGVGLYNGIKIPTIHVAALISAVIIMISVFIEVQTNPDHYSTRYSGILLNPNTFAINTCIIAAILFSSRKKILLFHIIGTAFVVIATLLSGSRKIAFFWLLFPIYIYNLVKKSTGKNKLGRSLILFSTSLLIVIITINFDTLLSFLGSLEFVRRFEKLFKGEDGWSGNVRMEMVREGFYLWLNNPFFGNGIGQFSVMSSFGVYSHNNYIEILSNLGLIGFFLYYGIYILIIFQLIAKKSELRPESNIIWSVMILLFLWDIARVSFVEKTTWVILVYIVYLCSNQKRDILILSK